ncbi:MAG: hypothetical protein LLF92_05685 [Planctomycetaceae bacterium]|nr:hypothetical protein [Planctomycetaceae bacterium]
MKSRIFIFVMCIFISGCGDFPNPGKGSNSDESTPARSNVDESKITGNRITSALATYRADHLEFPARLDLLVPKYIPKIDPPLSGNKSWIYKTYEDNQRYKLSFKTSTSGTSECYFDSKDNHWISE